MANKKSTRLWRNSNNVRTKLGSLKTGVAIKMAMEVATGSQELGHSESGNVLLMQSDTSMKDAFRIKGIDGEHYQTRVSGNWFKPMLLIGMTLLI